MDNYTLINKKIILSQDAKISVAQRCCRFGDGIFETIKIVNGKIYDYKAHKARLDFGLQALQIKVDISYLPEKLMELITKNAIKDGVLRLFVSRGEGSLGYLPKDDIEALIVAEISTNHKISSNRIRLGISKIRLQKRPNFLQKCKTMQGLNYILAKIAAKKIGNFDDILLNEKNYIAECSSYNIFWIKNNKIFTPSMKCDILPGIIRQKIIKKFKVNLVTAKLQSLQNADEVFITNSNFLVLNVDEIDFAGKKIKYKKNLGIKILDFIKEDIEKQCR
ncbi:MAG TPA: aminotransferase class IV [Rickettsiales bacterium]|nr:aminotransferase class IV [Rickettsiales bacterium]